MPSPPTVVPLLCYHRSGSSAIMSLLGESPRVLPLFELWNNFSHLRPHDAALHATVLEAYTQRFGPGPNMTERLLSHPARAVELAVGLARRLQRQTVTFKLFDVQCLMLWQRQGRRCAECARETFRRRLALFRYDASLWVRRNFFQRRVSEHKVLAARCSSFRLTDSTNCTVELPLAHTFAVLRVGVAASACLRCVAHGHCPHAHNASRPAAAEIEYDELRRLSEPARAALVARKLAAVGGGGGAPTSGARAASHYRVQDRRLALRSKLTNYPQLAAAYSPERRRQLCQQGARLFAAGDAAFEEETARWCEGSAEFDLPP